MARVKKIVGEQTDINEAYDSLLEGIDSIKIKIQEQKAKEQNV